MAINGRCCQKNYSQNKRKCLICNKLINRYVVRVRDNSQNKWRTKTLPSLKLAKEVEVKFKTQVLEGDLFDKKKVGSISFDKYLEYAKLHKKTYKMDISRWNLHVKDHNYKTEKGINAILSKMKMNGYADSTIHHVLKLISRLYNWSIENGHYFDTNPCTRIKAPKYDNKMNDYLSLEEIDNLLMLLENWDNKRAVNIVLFALWTGRRKGEITSLEWGDVDLNNKVITCRNTKNGKTLSFPLNEKAYKVILSAHEQKNSQYVFCSSTGHHYYNGFSLAWKRFKARNKLTYRFHSTRSTYASHLASSGKVDLYTLKCLLGHSDLSMTQRYAHLTDGAVKHANNVIDQIF